MMNWWNLQDVVIQIALIVFAAAVLFQILYYWIIFGRIAFFNPQKHAIKHGDALPRVSVIIVAESDYHNLRKNLTSILEQNYPDFEVVVVNSSLQETTSFFFLKSMQERYPHLKIVELPNVRTFYSRKKFLLAIGIKEAAHDIFLFTNTDCQPVSPNWIETMVGHIGGKKNLVLGYCSLTDTKTFANKFYRLDGFNASLMSLSWARCGMPYTGSGNNMAYSRNFFDAVNGYISHYAIPYGEDSLFINKNATKKNTSIVLDPDALVLSQSKMTFKYWLHTKKIARLSQKHFKKAHRFVLTLFPFTRFLSYATFIGLLVLLPLNIYYYILIGIFGLRLASQLIITKKSMTTLHEKGFLMLAPLLEPIYMLLSWITFFKALFPKKTIKRI